MSSPVINHAAAIYTQMIQNPGFWIAWIVSEKPDLKQEPVQKQLSFAAHLMAAGFSDFTHSLMAHMQAQESQGGKKDE